MKNPQRLYVRLSRNVRKDDIVRSLQRWRAPGPEPGSISEKDTTLRTVLRLEPLALVKSGCMLGTLSPRRGEGPALLPGSDNATGAGDQQERPKGILRNPQRLYARRSTRSEDTVRAPWRHGEADRNGGPPGESQVLQATDLSEIPCRVSSDPHERRNDLSAVSKRGSAKLWFR
jgi:hypothetical protein